jgi:hypothetical protein
MSKLKAKDPKQAIPARPKILIFGSYGVSKTWGALSFPNAYYIDTEGGANIKEYTDRLVNSGGRYMGPEDGANDLKEIIEQISALATEKHSFKTLIIDSITKPYNEEILREAMRLEKAGIKNEFSKDKKPAVNLMKRIVRWLDKLDMNVILIAREKAKWANQEQTGYQADVWDQLNYDLNLVLRISKQKEVRLAEVDKTRLATFPDGDAFIWSASPSVKDTTALDEFIKRMGSGIMDASKAIQLATEEQVAEINRLLGIVKVSEEDIEKMLEKAKAESWSELTTEQATGVINWLGKKLK